MSIDNIIQIDSAMPGRSGAFNPSLSPPIFGGKVPPLKIGGGYVGVDRISQDSLT